MGKPHCVKLHWRGRAACFLYLLPTPLSYRLSDMIIYCSSSYTIALRRHYKQTTGNIFTATFHSVWSNNKPCCCFGSTNKNRKIQINKHLLVFRLICSLLRPVFSHDALHSVPVVCMFCVAWRGFLNPPGLQLTPLLIGICPFSISIATHGKILMLQLQQKQKPSAGVFRSNQLDLPSW